MKQFAKKTYRRLLPIMPTGWIEPERFVMISGCPRSGTSACLQWMNSHPKTATFYENRIAYALSDFCAAVNRYEKLGERGDLLRREIRALFLRDAADQKNIRRKTLVLKEPVQATAFENIDQLTMLQNLQVVLSPLTIVLMARHPVNVVNSMMNRTWGGSIQGQEPRHISIERGIGAWKNAAAMSMHFKDDENVLTVRFEDFLEDPKTTAAKVAGKLGLPGTFEVSLKSTANISLTPEQVQLVMDSTAEEREALGYLDPVPVS